MRLRAPERAPRWLALIALVGLFASTLQRAAPVEGRPYARSDLPAFLAGSERLATGADPFGARGPRGWPYVYPPTLAVLLLPLRGLPPRLAAGLWLALSALVLALGATAFRRSLGRTGPWRTSEDLLPALLVALPLMSSLARGQVAALLTGLVALSAALSARRRDVASGLVLGLAVAIKATPAVLFLGLLVARRARLLAVAFLALTAWLVLLPAPWLGIGGAARSCQRFGQEIAVRFAREPGAATLTPEGRVRVQAPTNQSLVSHVARRTEGPLQTCLVVLVVSLALAPGLARSRRGDPPPEPAAWGALAAASLVLSPIAWHHHHVLAWPALAVLARRPRGRAATPALALFGLLEVAHFAGPASVRSLGLLGYGTLGLVLALGVPPPQAR